jgi:Polysaccharide lyase
MILRNAALIVALATGGAVAQPAPPQPVFSEDFAGDAFPAPGKWAISGLLDPAVRGLRIGAVGDPTGGKRVGRVTVESGDALDGATSAMLSARRYVCDGEGSRAAEMESEPGGVAPSERAEFQVKADSRTGAGELVKFGAPVWYRFSFKVAGDWPRDVPLPGRTACRVVIQQIKQNASKDGVDCGASPFFKIEARSTGEGVRFFAQVAAGPACGAPHLVSRTQLCRAELPRETWTTVNVRLAPAQDASGRADIWLNGAHCGSYRGPMGDAEHGARRNGVPFVDTQPRFGIYRDWRAETQTIYFDRIMFWDVDPTGHPDWGVGAAPP